MAQSFEPWQPVPIPDLISMPGEFIYSENLDLLVYTGNFLRPDGTKYIAGYDGNNWQHVLEIHPWGGGFKAMADYEDGLLICSGAECGVGPTLPYISYFDGEVEHCPWEFNGMILKLKWVNDTLYALGSFTEIDGVPAYHVARLVDGAWEGLLDPNLDLDIASFNDIEYYEGKLYVGGNIESDDWPQDLATIENGELVQVGAGLVGTWTSVGHFEVFNNELYIIGGIPYSQGNVGHHIVRWDGEEISPVGELLTDQQGQFSTGGGISDVVLMGDYLYIGGSFGFIGDEEISLFARWDGSQWCSVEAEGFGSSTRRCNKLGNEIIRFVWDVTLEDGEIMPIWKLNVSEYNPSVCTQPLSLSETEKLTFNLFPNPTSTLTTIQAPTVIGAIRVYNALGQLLFQRQPLAERVELDLRSLDPGIYLIEVRTTDGRAVKKLLVDD